MLRGDLRVLPRNRLELVLPDAVCRDRVRLVTHGDAGLAMCLGPLEGRRNDSLDALAGIDLFGDVLVPARAAPAEVVPFGVFSKDDEVDGSRILQRRQIGMQELDWPEVD